MHGTRSNVPWLVLLSLLLTVSCVAPIADDADVARDGETQEAGEALAQSAAPSDAATTCNKQGTAGPSTPRIFVVGDSTASNYEAKLLPRMGWPQPLQRFFAPACAGVENKALSGRSSKSFYDEGAFAPVRAALRAGDYLLIQFGHNDEKSDDPARYTAPFTTYQQYLTRYVNEARGKNAIPILLTSINRNKWSGNKLSDSHGQYPEAVRQLATKLAVPLVDMTQLTKAYFERIGPKKTNELFMNLAPGESPNYPRGNEDNTHLQERGARIIAQMVLAEVRRQRLPLGNLVNAPVVAP